MDRFPVGGRKQEVFDYGFVMGKFSDKHWTRGDLSAHVYGAGSKLRIFRGGELLIDDKIEKAIAFIADQPG